jgi:hypothetical protein
MAEEAAKRKNEKSSRHYFLQFPLRLEGTVDPVMASPVKKKHKNDDTLGIVIEIDMDSEEMEASKEEEDHPLMQGRRSKKQSPMNK